MFLKDTNIGRLILEQLQTEKTASVDNVGKVCVDDAQRISKGLLKVAGFPHQEETYTSVQEMMKIASRYMTNLSSAFKSVQSRNSDLEKAAEVRELIDEIANVGGVDEFSVREKIAELMSKTPRELEIIKEATKMFQNGKEGNTFFEIEKTSSVSSSSRRSIFDGVEGL